LSNVVVEGENSLLNFHGLMTPIAVDGSSNVTVRNLEVDFPHPSVIEALVTATTPTTLDLQVHPSASYTIHNGSITFGSGEGWSLGGSNGLQPATQSDKRQSTLCQEFDPVSDTTWRRGNPLSGATVTQLPQPNSVRVTYKKPAQDQASMLGHWLWFRDGGRPNVGLLTQYSSQITYQNMAFRFMSSFGSLAQYTRDIHLQNVSIETTKASGRFCACEADLLHFSGCGGQITVNGGRFVGSQDDGVNVQGTHLRIVAQPSPTSIVVQFMHPESYGFDAFFSGDRVQFTRADSLEAFGQGVVSQAYGVRNSSGCPASPSPAELLLPCQIVLELQSPLTGARLNTDVVENLEYTPDVTITGAYFNRIPTRGILATTRGKVIIRNNTIHSAVIPLHIADDAASWYESGPVSDVLFEGNVVVRNGKPRRDTPVVDVSPSNTKPATVHRNLRVLNNEIHLFDTQVSTPIVAGKAIEGITFSGNRIFSSRAINQTDMVVAENCSGVLVENNTVSPSKKRTEL
jgi:hypothetical protein